MFLSIYFNSNSYDYLSDYSDCSQLKFQSNIVRDINHSRYLGTSGFANSAKAQFSVQLFIQLSACKFSRISVLHYELR